MEINDQAIAALKKKMASALEAQKQSLLGFAGEGRASAEEIYAALVEDARDTAGYYPGFELKAELENQEFMAMLQAGVPIRRAYEAIHHRELVQAAMAYAMRCGGSQCPAENGLGSQASAAAPGSMASSTRQQRDAIRSRVSRGETVRL